MKANAPKKLTLIIALILAIVAVLLVLLVKVVTIPLLTVNAFWILLVGFCLLFLGCVLKNF